MERAYFAGHKLRENCQKMIGIIYKQLVSELAQLISLSIAIVSNGSEQNCANDTLQELKQEESAGIKT